METLLPYELTQAGVIITTFGTQQHFSTGPQRRPFLCRQVITTKAHPGHCCGPALTTPKGVRDYFCACDRNRWPLCHPSHWPACLWGSSCGWRSSLCVPTLGPATGSELHYDKGEIHLHPQAVYSATLWLLRKPQKRPGCGFGTISILMRVHKDENKRLISEQCWGLNNMVFPAHTSEPGLLSYEHYFLLWATLLLEHCFICQFANI